MTALNKQALRLTAEKAQEHGVFNMDIHSETVLALLDELEATEKRIAELEARTVTLPDVEKWRSVDAVRAQSAYKVLVSKVLAAAGIGVKGE